MARVYQRKKTSTKIVEGVSSGLIGGLVFIVVSMIADLILRSGDLLYTISRLGSIFTGSLSDTGATAFGAPFLVGALIILVLFALAGIGFVSYLPIIYKLGLSKALFGAIYGVFLWLAIFLTLLGLFSSSVAGSINLWVALASCVIAGAALGWGLDYVMSRKGGDINGNA